MAVNRVSMYCCTLQMAEARELMTALRPTFSMTFWKAVGDCRVILHRADIAVIRRASTVECLKRCHRTGPISPVVKPCAWAENVVQTFSIIFAAM